MYGMLQKLQDKIGKDKVILGDPVVAIQQVCIFFYVISLLYPM